MIVNLIFRKNEWLISSGIAYRILNVSKPEYPLKAYEILNYFKLFLLDIGLIKHMAGLTNKSILLSESFQFKGQLAENYVLEQLIPLLDNAPNFYAFAQDREIDFILQQGENIIPVEVKSGENKRAVSFKSYIEKHKPETAVRFSTREYLKNGAITNIPLYFAGKIFELINEDNIPEGEIDEEWEKLRDTSPKITESGIIFENGDIFTSGIFFEVVKEARDLLLAEKEEEFKMFMLGPKNPSDGIRIGEKVKQLTDEEFHSFCDFWIEERNDTLRGILSDLCN